MFQTTPDCQTSFPTQAWLALAAPVLDFPPAVVLDQPDIFTNVLNTSIDSGRNILLAF